MRTPWQQAFYEEYGMDYESEFEQGGGPFNPGCTHPWEISNSSSSTSAEWVFDRRDHTTPPPSRRRFSPPESPPRRRVTDIDRSEVSPQPMAHGLRSRRGNSTTVTSRPIPRRPSSHNNCVVPAQKPSPRHASSKSCKPGKHHARDAYYAQRKAQPQARQTTACLARGPGHSRCNAKPPIAGKWVFIPNKRETRTKPRRSAPKETAMPSHLAAQATAVLMFVIFIAACVYTLKFAQHYKMN
jgi:hypothetical protein